MRRQSCAYCGENQPDGKDHVIPRCLYPESMPPGSGVQLVTVPVCRTCHVGFPDETQFRQVIAVAGQPNAAVRELWDGPIARSHRRTDGPKRVGDLFQLFRYEHSPGGRRAFIYPAQDPSVLGTTRKVIRGFCAHFDLEWAVPDENVLTDILQYEVPREFLETMRYFDCQADIFSCRYRPMHGVLGIHSAWLLTFFGRVLPSRVLSLTRVPAAMNGAR